MTVSESPRPTLAELTTLRLGGPATEVVETHDEASLVEAVRSADERGTPVLIVGGGSNLVVSDEGFDGRVVVVRNTGLEVESDLCGGAFVEIGAGVNWDDVVATAVDRGWVGIEALSGIPGTTGATPIQNVGAYGQEISQTSLASAPGTVSWAASAPSPRPTAASGTAPAASRRIPAATWWSARPSSSASETSVPPSSTPSWPTPWAWTSVPARRPATCARPSSTCGGARPWCSTTRTTTRGAPAPSSPTRSCRPGRCPKGRPPGPNDGLVKTSAAWLIERAGFSKGYGNDRVRLSSRHTLAITNRGGASTTELLALAREIRDGVEQRFGIELVNEPVLVNCSL